jgi:type II secretory pathway component PulJ
MTLLELIVTMAIFGALVVMLVSIFHSSIQASQAVERHVSLISRAYGATDIIVKDLEAMHVYDSRAYLMVDVIPFSRTTGTSIAFPTSTPVRVTEHLRDRPGLVEIAYLIATDPSNPETLWLFRRELEIETNRSAKEIRMADQGVVLLVDGLEAFHMEFLSQDASQSTEGVKDSDWVEKWDSGFGQSTLPAAIRISLTVGSKSGGPQMAIQRTVRIPTPDISVETHEAALKRSLGLAP